MDRDESPQWRILAVEDNAELAEMIRTFLESQGFEVLEAGDGDVAVQVAREHRPHLILMDLQLPTVSGLEATRRIRRDFNLSRTPIVAVTGFAMERDAASAYASGCDAYVTKPYDFDELIEAIRRLIK